MQDKEFTNKQVRTAKSRVNDRGWITRNIGSLLPQATADIRTLYALDNISLSPQTLVRAGVRYDDYTYDAESNANFTDRTQTLQEVNFSTASWTLGLERTLWDDYTLELGVATGFRAPTIEDMYSISGSVDDWGTIANPDLEAEQSINFDLALSGNLGETGIWRAGLFVSRFKDFIDYVPTTGINTNTGLLDPNGYSTPMNFNDVDMQGFEFSGSMSLAALTGIDGLSTTLQGAYTEGENGNGDPVYSIQPYNLTWSLGYAPRPASHGLNLFVTHNAGKDSEDAYRTDAKGLRTYPLYVSNTSTVLDLMGYFNIGSQLTVSAAINNLTNKEYYNWDSVRFVDQGDERPGIGVSGRGIRRYSEAGRNYELTVNYQF
jgi:hemoglobin/transferrin/lactoferrin receptor protein